MSDNYTEHFCEICGAADCSAWHHDKAPAMTEDHEAAEVAKGLTKAQRSSVLRAYQTRKPAGGQQFWTVDITCQPWPQGVAQYRSPNTDTLTPLGLRVRAHLQGETA